MSSGVASSIWAVVSQLEAHAAVLLAECEEIRADYERCREYTQRYGDHWELAIRRLKKLRAAKQSMLNEVKFQLGVFSMQIEKTTELCRRIEALNKVRVV